QRARARSGGVPGRHAGRGRGRHPGRARPHAALHPPGPARGARPRAGPAPRAPRRLPQGPGGPVSRVPGTPPGAPPVTLPRLGFVGVGWIGRRRMGALARSGAAEVAAIVEPSEERARLALAEAALARGKAVFCQKPLGRTAREVARVVRAARRADRLLGVDLSYRYTEGMQRIAEALRAGEIGPVYAVELAFHNAYGPDRPWFYDARFSGGGCVMDLG